MWMGREMTYKCVYCGYAASRKELACPRCGCGTQVYEGPQRCWKHSEHAWRAGIYMGRNISNAYNPEGTWEPCGT